MRVERLVAKKIKLNENCVLAPKHAAQEFRLILCLKCYSSINYVCGVQLQT